MKEKLGAIERAVLKSQEEKANIKRAEKQTPVLFSSLLDFVDAHRPKRTNDPRERNHFVNVDCLVPLTKGKSMALNIVEEEEHTLVGHHYDLQISGLDYSYQIYEKTGQVMIEPKNKLNDYRGKFRPMNLKDVKDVKTILERLRQPDVKIKSYIPLAAGRYC